MTATPPTATCPPRRASVDRAFDAIPALLAKSSTGDRVSAVGSGAVDDRLRDRVLAGVLERGSDAEELVAVDAVGGNDIDQGHASGRDGAGLVEDDGVDAPGRLEDLGAS